MVERAGPTVLVEMALSRVDLGQRYSDEQISE